MPLDLDQQIDPYRVLRDIERVECEESLATFLRNGWRYIDPAPFIDGWVIDALCEHLQAVCDGQIRKLLINQPPRTLKSTLTAVTVPAWIWAQSHKSHTSGPGVKFLHGSYADKLSLRDSVRCRRLIESAWYQSLWGDSFKLSGDQNAKHRFSNDQGGERLITSIGAGVTGEGYDVGIFDDCNASNEMSSDIKPETVIEWWDYTMATRMNNPRLSAWIMIQQRLAQNDISGHILERAGDDVVHLCLPMRYDPVRSFVTSIGWEDPRTEEGDLLWPDRFGEAEVKALELQLGPWASAGQLQQLPRPKGGGIIRDEWWNLWEHEKVPPLDFIVAFLDTAYTEKKENDFSAMTVWGVFTSVPSRISGHADNGAPIRLQPKEIVRDGRRVDIAPMDTLLVPLQHPRVLLLGAWQERIEINALVTKVAATCKRKDFEVDKLLIENKGPGISVAQELRRLFGHEAFGIELVDPGNRDKVNRLYAIQPLFAPSMDAKGNALLNAKGELAQPGVIYAPGMQYANMVIDQVSAFPKGKHDDLVDTVSGALGWLRKTGMLQRSEEWTAELTDQLRRPTRPDAPIYPV